MRTNDISITVEKIYHAAADPRGWNAVLSDIASITKSTMSCLFWSGSRRTHYDYIASLGVPEWYLKEYAEYFVETDEWFKGGRGILKSGWVGRSQELCSDQRLARTEFYSDFLRRADVFHQCGGVMTMAGCRLATVSLLRPKKLGAYDQSSVEAIKLLMPHLQRAMRLHEKFVDLREHDMSMEAALQTLATAMILTDSERKVLFANRAAQAILDRRDGLLVVRGGIGATSRSESTQLSALVGAATPRVGCKSAATGGSMLISRGQSRPLSVLVSPLCWAQSFFPARAVAIVFINDPDGAQLVPTHALKRYGLTPAEVRLALLLAEGKSLRDAAGNCGVKVSTVRSQLRAIFSKVGVNRQSQLVGLLHRS